MIFILLLTLTPSTYDAQMFFYLNKLKFSWTFIGVIQAANS